MRSYYASNEEDQSGYSKSLSDSIEAILIDKASLNISDSHVVNVVDPKPATNLDAVENFSSAVNIEIPVIMKEDIQHETTNTSFTGNHANDSGSHAMIANSGDIVNDISDSSILKDGTNKTENIIKEDLNHEKWNSQDGNTKSVTSMPKNLSKSKKKDSSSSTTHSAWRFKLLLIFGACCIIGCYLMPLAVYGIESGSNDIDDDYSSEQNISSANVRTYVIFNDYSSVVNIL